MGLSEEAFSCTNANYDVTFNVTDGWLEITPAKLKITVKDQTYVYNSFSQGENNKTYTDADDIAAKVNVEGLQGSRDKLTSITLNGTHDHVGEYPNRIAASGAVVVNEGGTNNYEIEYVAGKLTITPAKLKITVKDQTYTYNGQPQGEDEDTYSGTALNNKVTVEGLLGQDEIESITLDGQETNAGVYTGRIDATSVMIHNEEQLDGTDPNYTVTVVKGTLTIEPKAVTVTITGHHDSQVYNGGTQGVNGYDVSIPNGVNITLDEIKRAIPIYELDGSISATDYHTAAQDAQLGQPEAARSWVGTTDMGLKEGNFSCTNNNYNVKFVVTDGYMTITPAALTITVKDQTYTYNGQPQGEDNKIYTTGIDAKVTVEGLKGSDGLTSITLNGQETNAGVYTGKIAASGAMVGTAGKTKNYTVTYVAGTLTINKATLPEDPDDPSETRYDVSQPANHVYDGQAHRENITVTDNNLPAGNKDITSSFDITYDTSDFVNVKTITVTITAKKDSNYEGSFTRTYQITPAPLTIRADNKTKVYGSADPALTATLTGLVQGDSVDYTLSRDPGEDVGSYVIHVTVPQQAKRSFFAGLLGATKPANANYKITTVNGTFRITPAPLTITTGSANKVYDGTALTSGTFTVTGLQRGDSVTITTSGSQTAVGSSRNTYSIVWDGAKEANYTVTSNLGTLTVTAAPTPTPTPTPTPGGGTVTPTPNIVPTPAEPEVEPEVVPDEPTPEVTPEPEPIEPEPTPVAPPAGAWALINLLCAIGSALLSIINLILYFTGKKDDEDDDNNGEQTAAEGGAEEDDENKKELKRKGLVKLLSLIPGIGSVIVFFLTEDMSLPMVMVDKWTILMVILLVVTIVMAVLSKKTKKDADKEEEQTQTQA